MIALFVLLAAAGGAPLKSGLQVGEAVPSWQPIHVAGPDRGKRACPTCSYGARPMIQVFTKDGPNAGLLAAEVERLVSAHQAQQLKGFVAVVDSTPARVKQLARRLGMSKAALCYPAPGHEQTDLRRKLKIDPAAQNTIIVYRDFVVTANFVDVDGHDLQAFDEAVEKVLR